MTSGPSCWRIGTQETAEAVSEALSLIPPRCRELVRDVPVWEGDLVFGGHWRSSWGVHEPRARCHWKRMPTGWYRSTISMPWPAVAKEVYWQAPLTALLLHEYGHALLNRLLRRLVRYRRVFWSVGDGEVVVKYNTTGLLPALRPFVGHKHWPDGTDLYMEQFCEAFRIWCSPWHVVEQPWEPGQFYQPAGGVDYGGWRTDNRRVLAWLNALEGWAWDTPPRALRSGP